MDMDAYHHQQHRFYGAHPQSTQVSPQAPSQSSSFYPSSYPPPSHQSRDPSMGSYSSNGNYASLYPPTAPFSGSFSGSASGSASNSASSSQYSGSVHSSPEGGSFLEDLYQQPAGIAAAAGSTGMSGASTVVSYTANTDVVTAASRGANAHLYGGNQPFHHRQSQMSYEAGYYGQGQARLAEHGRSNNMSNVDGNRSGSLINQHGLSSTLATASISSVAPSHSMVPSSSTSLQHVPRPSTRTSASVSVASNAPPSAVFAGSTSASLLGTPLSRPLTVKEQDLLAHLDRLKFFLATAPSRWSDDGSSSSSVHGSFHGDKSQVGTLAMPHPIQHPALNRFLLPSGE